MTNAYIYKIWKSITSYIIKYNILSTPYKIKLSEYLRKEHGKLLKQEVKVNTKNFDIWCVCLVEYIWNNNILEII